MRKRTKVVLAAGVAAVIATTGGIAAAAAVGDDDGTEVQITGPARSRPRLRHSRTPAVDG